MAIPCFTTIETAVEKVNLFHSNLQIFTSHFVITADKVLTVKIKIISTACTACNLFLC